MMSEQNESPVGDDERELSNIFPAPWTVDKYAKYVWSDGGMIFDIRGWGRLTGCGIGGLGLDEDTAIKAQKALGELACMVHPLLSVLMQNTRALGFFYTAIGEGRPGWEGIRQSMLSTPEQTALDDAGSALMAAAEVIERCAYLIRDMSIVVDNKQE